MQRKKLQSMVQSALAAQTHISTEGFLGDIASKIGSLFSNRKKVLESGDYTKKDPSADILIARLKETVLNSQWMEKATEKKSPIAANWAIPGLDYKNQLTSDIADHLKKVVPLYLKDAAAFHALQVTYCETTNALYAAYLKEMAAAYKAGNDLSKVVSKYQKKADGIKAPAESLKSKPLEVFRNRQLICDSKASTVITTLTKPSSVTSVEPLTKGQVVEIAELLITVLSSPIVTNEGIRFDVDWDDVEARLVKYGATEEEADILYADVTEVAFVERFYHQRAWDEAGTYELSEEHKSLIKGLIHLIDASIK